MTKALNLIKRFAADEEGTALMEYTILLGILVVAVITIITTLGGWIHTQWQTLCTNLTNNGACP
jgi:pilus assembly protein Flp/PilA